MTWYRVGLVAGLFLFILALVPVMAQHGADIVIIVISGVLLISVSIFGFGISFSDPEYMNKLMIISVIVFVSGLLIYFTVHTDGLFFVSLLELDFVDI
jgi:hypothetical protein